MVGRRTSSPKGLEPAPESVCPRGVKIFMRPLGDRTSAGRRGARGTGPDPSGEVVPWQLSNCRFRWRGNVARDHEHCGPKGRSKRSDTDRDHWCLPPGSSSTLGTDSDMLLARETPFGAKSALGNRSRSRKLRKHSPSVACRQVRGILSSTGVDSDGPRGTNGESMAATKSSGLNPLEPEVARSHCVRETASRGFKSLRRHHLSRFNSTRCSIAPSPRRILSTNVFPCWLLASSTPQTNREAAQTALTDRVQIGVTSAGS